MSFALPIGLLALLAVPLVAGLSLLARRRRRRYAIRFPAAGTWSPRPERRRACATCRSRCCCAA